MLQIFWVVKSDSSFALSPPFFFHFFCLIFFSFTGHLVDFILVGNAFRKAFRVLELMKGMVGG